MKCEDTSRISFESFVSILSILSIKTEFEEKKKGSSDSSSYPAVCLILIVIEIVLFEIFDHDRDGFISAQDYYTTLAPRMNPLFGQEEWKHIAKNIIQSKIADIPGSPSGLALSDFTSVRTIKCIRKSQVLFNSCSSLSIDYFYCRSDFEFHR